jgi:hypothetical protein
MRPSGTRENKQTNKVSRPQTILKFRPPSSLDYRTRHGSQSLDSCNDPRPSQNRESCLALASKRDWKNVGREFVLNYSEGMNLNVVAISHHATVFFLSHFCPVAFFRQMIALTQKHAQENLLLVLFMLAQKCLWTLKVSKMCYKIILF